ncbi:hypothetical protein BH23ACT6_BH23ACT6_08490 [soil metagenome]
MALLGALCVGLNALGFTNRCLRAQVSHLLGTAYTVNQASYDLARLRLNGSTTRRPVKGHTPRSLEASHPKADRQGARTLAVSPTVGEGLSRPGRLLLPDQQSQQPGEQEDVERECPVDEGPALDGQKGEATAEGHE